MTRAGVIAAAAAGLAACSHTSMVIEVVTSDPAITRVELVLVEKKCTTCTYVAPPSSVKETEGDVYYQVAGDRFTAPVGGGVAGFTVEPGASDEIAKLGAIGFDARGVAKAIALVDQELHIKAHLGEVVQIDLVSREIQAAAGATPGFAPGAPPGFAPGANDTVVVWRAPNAPDAAASCIAVLRAASASGPANTYVVPPADPDCDGITGAAECDPFWYAYATPADDTHPQYCLAQESATAACAIGTEVGCVDGQSQAGCHSLGYCVPQRACADCTDPTDPQCADEVGLETEGFARIRCTIPLIGGAGNYTACQTGIAPVNLDAPYATVPNAACNPGLIKTPVVFPLAIQPSISFDTGQGGMTLMIASPNAPCEFKIVPAGNVGNIPSRSVPALVALRGPTRTILVPLVVAFTSANQTTCSGAATAAVCTIEQDAFADPMWTCAGH